MTDNLPSLKEIYEKNYKLKDAFISYMVLRKVGYSTEDFENFMTDFLNNSEVSNEEINDSIPFVKFMLRNY